MLRFLYISFTKASRPATVGFHVCFAFLLLAGCMFSAAAMAAGAIGAVDTVTGQCRLLRGSDTLGAEPRQPVMLNDAVSTGEDARLSIVFLDETVLTLDESSHAAIDSYVYSDDASNLLFKFTKGTFRTITGGIVKQNPEGFNMETPLATIGIRGSDVYAIVQPDGEETGALHLDENHVLEVKTRLQTVRITQSGLRVKISPTGVISAPSPIPPDVLDFMQDLRPMPPTVPSGTAEKTNGKLKAPPVVTSPLFKAPPLPQKTPPPPVGKRPYP